MTAQQTPAPEVVVKPLEWLEMDDGTFWSVPTMVGLRYHISGQGWCFRNGDMNHISGGIEASASAAQADYTARILSALDLSALTRTAATETLALEQAAGIADAIFTESNLMASEIAYGAQEVSTAIRAAQPMTAVAAAMQLPEMAKLVKAAKMARDDMITTRGPFWAEQHYGQLLDALAALTDAAGVE